MMAGFTKLFSSIVTSSIWSEDDKTRIVWVTMLATADSTGHVDGSIPGLAHIARVSVGDCERALERLMAPDPYSRTKDHEGRRIEEVDGGWKILNYEKYRETGNPVRASLDMRGYVYYAGVPGADRVKIGFSKNPWARVNDLRVVEPGLEILATERATMAREKERHDQFKRDRLEMEWFRCTESLASLIHALAGRDHRRKATATTVATPVVKPVATVGTEAEAEAEADTDPAIAGAAPWDVCKAALHEAFGTNRTIVNFVRWMANTYLIQKTPVEIALACARVRSLIAKSRTAEKDNPPGWFIGAVKRPESDDGFGYRPTGRTKRSRV